MQSGLFLKTVAWNLAVLFTWTQVALAAPSGSFFSQKRPDHRTSTQQQLELLQGKRQLQPGRAAETAAERATRNHAGVAREAFQFSHLTDLTDFHIPEAAGRITEVYDPPGTAPQDRRLVVLIQDLHTQPEAQRNLARILQYLRQHHDLPMVASEGASGPLLTEALARAPVPELRRQVADRFLDAGELSGEEYLALTTDSALRIEGVEDPETYFPNLLAFHEVMAGHSSTQLVVDQLTAVLDALKPKLWNRRLLTLDAQRAAYEAGTLEPGEYVAWLTQLWGQTSKGSDPLAKAYPEVARFQQLLMGESQLDEARVQLQTTRLISNVSTATLGDEAAQSVLDPLMVAAAAMEQSTISSKTFYTQMAKVADQLQPAWRSTYPAVAVFSDYLALNSQLDSTALYIQLQQLYVDVQHRVAKTREARALAEQLRRVEFLEGFINLRISNEQLDAYLVEREVYTISAFRNFLQPQLERHRLTRHYVDYNAQAIDARLPVLERFYELVKARDVSMVQNTLRVMEEHHARFTALVVGGFHTRGITQRLRAAGLSYVVVSPQTDGELDYDRYHNLLAGIGTPIPQLLAPVLATGGLRTMLPMGTRLAHDGEGLLQDWRRLTSWSLEAMAAVEAALRRRKLVAAGIVLALVVGTAVAVGTDQGVALANGVPPELVGPIAVEVDVADQLLVQVDELTYPGEEWSVADLSTSAGEQLAGLAPATELVGPEAVAAAAAGSTGLAVGQGPPARLLSGWRLVHRSGLKAALWGWIGLVPAVA